MAWPIFSPANLVDVVLRLDSWKLSTDFRGKTHNSVPLIIFMRELPWVSHCEVVYRACAVVCSKPLLRRPCALFLQ